jgi:pyridoxamine 5'-phosphate oxidase
MIDNKEIANLRRTYSERELSKSGVRKDPFEQFSLWLQEAIDSDIIEPNAMTITTCGKDCRPTARTVLLKGIEQNGFTFYTNFESKKAKDISENPFAGLLFFWRELGRQISISGEVKKISEEESEIYFLSRPYGSRIGAWASRQSSEIPSRDYLEKKFKEIQRKFSKGNIPLPPFWGGFRLYPERFEFWQGRESRMHDRIGYVKEKDGWKIVRLSP